MLKIRMQRIGKKNDPAFRVVVAEHTVGPKAGNFLERLGSYYPKTKERVLNEERIKHWISMGAKPSDTMHNMLISAGIIEGKKINVLPSKTPIVKEEEPVAEVVTETPADAPAEAEVTEEESAPEAPAEETPVPEAEAAPEEAPKEEVAEAPETEEEKQA